MSRTWFVGDLHLDHEKVARLRGFPAPLEHDVEVWTTWRRQVAADDLVYVLGDISAGGSASERYALSFLRQMPGRKRLIAGNHDSIAGIHRRPSPNTEEFRSTFEQIHDHGRIRLEGRQILLSHYPYASQGDGPGRGEARHLQYRLPDLGALLIHAHTHHDHPTSGSTTGRELCVSWDAWRRLVGIADIAEWLTTTKGTA